ncbi:MAG: hypothetical protein QOF51_2430 [Chloroflexota bacterium]|jgi:DNA-binding response OmpR family regulator|nr:hypothetical protein [Chloroflexota bacterium]
MQRLRTPAPTQQTPATTQADAGRDHSARVLVIEDDEQTREVLRILIGFEGCDVETCTTWDAGNELIERWQPDLILLSADLPGLEVGQTIASCTAEGAHPAPFVLLTTQDYSDEWAQALGAQAVLRKPFAVDELLSLLRLYAPCK